nr:hypothetical protein [Tanacetum cinerariifolium]
MDNALAKYTKNLEKAEKEIDELKLILEKLQNSSKSLNILLESQVSDKDKTGLGYKAASLAVEGFVNSSKILEKQENRSDKGYHAVHLPFTGNYVPPKHNLRLINEHFESVSVDVISNIAPSDVKTVESKHKTVDVNHKGVFSTEQPKPVMKNNYSPLIIEDWHLDDKTEITNYITWCTRNSETYLDVDAKMDITCLIPCYAVMPIIYTRPFSMLPTSTVEAPATRHFNEASFSRLTCTIATSTTNTRLREMGYTRS